METSHKFIACWTSQGLDSIYNVSLAEKAASWAKLKGETYVWPYTVNLLKLNAHRRRSESYEIYQFESDKTLDYLKQEFDKNPQPLVEWIRETGICYYSSYHPADTKKIK